MVGNFQVKGQPGGSRRLSSVVFEEPKTIRYCWSGAEQSADSTGAGGVTELVQLQR